MRLEFPFSCFADRLELLLQMVSVICAAVRPSDVISNSYIQKEDMIAISIDIANL